MVSRNEELIDRITFILVLTFPDISEGNIIGVVFTLHGMRYEVM